MSDFGGVVSPVTGGSAAAVRIFVFADIRGYTAYTRQRGDEAGAELTTQFASIVRELAPGFEGVLQELRGDEALIVFDSARQALRFAVALQARTAADELARPIGVGLDVGEAVEVEEGFRGGALNRASRLCSLAQPGEVLATDGVRELAGATEGVVFGFRRTARLKGYEHPVPVVEIHAAGAARKRQLRRRLVRRVTGTRPRLRLAVAAFVVAIAVLVPLELLASPAAAGVRRVMLPAAPAAMAAGHGSLWMAEPGQGDLLRFDLASRSIADRVSVPGEPGSVALGGNAVWAASALGGAISRIDPTTDNVTQTVRLQDGSTAALAFGRGALWAAEPNDDTVVEIDPRTGGVRRRIAIALRPSAIAVGSRSTWVADYDAGEVAEVTGGGLGVTARVGDGPSALALGAGALWVANSLDSTVTKVDPATGRVEATIPVGSWPSGIVVAHGAVWVANRYSGTVSRLDPQRDTVVDTVPTGGQASAVAFAAGRLWVGDGPGPAAGHAGGTLRLVLGGPPFELDPARQFFFASGFQFIRLAYDTLVTFAAAPGPAGLELVPDLAVSLPQPSADDTVYTFRLRPGIRYSDGRAVHASDFRRAIEREFRLQGPAQDFFSGIVGADRCGPRRCDLSNGIRTDDATGTIVFRLRAPDPDFPFKLAVQGFAAPVPPGTPEHDVGDVPVPGTGPYRIVSASSHEVRFERNPLFHEWSHAAQPAGYPDSIVWRSLPSLGAAEREVEQGKADWILNLPPGDIRRLSLQYPSRLQIAPTFSVQFFSLNTHEPPFDDVRARRALNYAIDRARIARMYGGRLIAAPLCQPLAPELPGFRRYCPYTTGPRRDGVWTAPDLSKARALVAASGTRGDRVLILGNHDEGFIPNAVPTYVASVLRSIGYRATVRLEDAPGVTGTTFLRAQLNTTGDWLPDYPTASAYFPLFFSCGSPNGSGYVCDHTLDRRMREAERLQLQDPRQAATLWGRIDRELTNRAYWVPTVNNDNAELVSKRLGNYESNPIGDFIADQAWVR